jgi:hypothetical protein
MQYQAINPMQYFEYGVSVGIIFSCLIAIAVLLIKKRDERNVGRGGVEPSKPWPRPDDPIRYEVHLSQKPSECYVKRNGEKLERVSSVEILHDMNGNNRIPRVSVGFVLRKNDTLDITTNGEIQEGKSSPLTNRKI